MVQLVVGDISHAEIQLPEAPLFARPSSYKLLVWAPASHQPSPKGVSCKRKMPFANLKAYFSEKGALIGLHLCKANLGSKMMTGTFFEIALPHLMQQVSDLTAAL